MRKLSPRERSLLHVQQTGFIKDDLRLFLDTHPDSRDALNALKEYTALEAEARAEYECRYGALSQQAVARTDEYDWVDSPWPWEAEV